MNPFPRMTQDDSFLMEEHLEPIEHFERVILAEWPIQSILSPHGPHHWARVCRNGIYLLEKQPDLRGALVKGGIENPELCMTYFAAYHDSRRENDGYDETHGPRASAYFTEHVTKGMIDDLSQTEAKAVAIACHEHTVFRGLMGIPNGMANPVISFTAFCCDADRLDLLRLGMWPDLDLLFTPVAKKIAKDKLYSELNYELE